MIRYVFKDSDLLTIKDAKRASAQKIGEELETLAKDGKDHLTPAAVVQRARDKKNVLHKHFEWDDAKAADHYRLDQARSLIRSIHVENEEVESGRTRAFLSIADRDGTSYRPIGTILNSADLQSRILASAEKDLLAFENRYRELLDVCEFVRAAREKLAARRPKPSDHDSRPTA